MIGRVHDFRFKGIYGVCNDCISCISYLWRAKWISRCVRQKAITCRQEHSRYRQSIRKGMANGRHVNIRCGVKVPPKASARGEGGGKPRRIGVKGDQGIMARAGASPAPTIPEGPG